MRCNRSGREIGFEFWDSKKSFVATLFDLRVKNIRVLGKQKEIFVWDTDSRI